MVSKAAAHHIDSLGGVGSESEEVFAQAKGESKVDSFAMGDVKLLGGDVRLPFGLSSLISARFYGVSGVHSAP